ncbi:UvrD-helicase domain-containing protein [soil metagenome]
MKDTAARARIATGTGETLFVDAGAGSGKTQSLVDRVATLVLTDGIPLREIAAVTFTEKAGAELRDRLRVEFEAASLAAGQREAGTARRQRALAEAALDDLDSAAIGTLHSFAQRILGENPIEAKLPPLIEVLDQIASSVAFEDRWAELRVALLDDDSIREPLLLAMAAGVELEHLRSLTRLLGNDWDLAVDRIVDADPPPDPAVPDVSDLVAEAVRIAALAEHCYDEDDKLLPRLAQIGAWAERLALAPDPETTLAVLGQASWKVGNVGRQGNWPDIRAVRDAAAELCQRATDAKDAVLDFALCSLTHWLAHRVVGAAQERRAEGRLEFHDLLVLARELLRGPADSPAGDVRATLSTRYRRLLLDEFQDTDPIQIELAVRIAGGRDASQDSWQDVAIPPGSLFVVGDPKQSIYRFRRADIGMYLQAQRVLGLQGVSLTTNFRTVTPILDWVNTFFGSLITAEEGKQPAYAGLDSCRESEPDAGPPVTVLGAVEHLDGPNASTLREREAADVAGMLRVALDPAGPWGVFDRRTAMWRDARAADVAVLVPSRTSLPFLEAAFDAEGVPYRAESSSLVYEASEVRDLLGAARAVADPSDALALVTALRSALFGCGDDDLWRWKQAGGVFHLLAPVTDEMAAMPVGQALGYLRRLHRESRWMPPSELLGRLVADRRMLEAAGRTAGPRARDQWRRLRFVVDQARAWSEAEHGGLRAYLAWASRQGEETSRVAEAVLPETDAEAVRVMTVHAAKGLEFPIVVLSGMTSGKYTPRGVRLLWTADSYAVSIRQGLHTEDFETAQPVDEQMDDLERRRLLYVAATRARDHLVVSLHRSGGRETSAVLLCAAGAAERAAAFTADDPVPVPPGDSGTAQPAPDYDAWLASLTALRSRSREPSSVSASGLEGTDPSVTFTVTDPGTAKGQRSVELPPWSKGRYGTAVGRAVHGVLQGVDLATGAGLAEAVRAQCLAEGVLDYEDAVRALSLSALDSDVVRAASVRPHWRETYVGTVDGAQVLEGFVDLIYRDDDGRLVIVDYKTDAVPEAAIPARLAFYAPQMQAYVRAFTEMGMPRPAAVFLFAQGSGAPALERRLQ